LQDSALVSSDTKKNTKLRLSIECSVNLSLSVQRGSIGLVVRVSAGQGGVIWQAQGGREDYKVAQFATPEEAVAKLWLALKPRAF
jgi:hypothetical protein